MLVVDSNNCELLPAPYSSSLPRSTVRCLVQVRFSAAVPGGSLQHQNLTPDRRWVPGIGGPDHLGAWFVTALTVMLLRGRLVPFMVAPPKNHVELPSETILDSAGAD